MRSIAKSTSVEEYRDLRPISTLPVLSTVLDTVDCSQLTRFFKDNLCIIYNIGILPEIQSEIHTSYSTETALVHVYDDMPAA